MKSNIKVVTEGFRAIGHAAIQISGITVVAGENSSGKSTISKLLYKLFNTVANYEVLVKEELIREFNDLFQFFKIVSTDLKEFNYFNIRQLSYEGVYNDPSPTCRSSCSPRAPTPRTSSRAWRRGPTTT